jgi:hypothetical protein
VAEVRKTLPSYPNNLCVFGEKQEMYQRTQENIFINTQFVLFTTSAENKSNKV